LLSTKAISQQDYDDAVANQGVYNADCHLRQGRGQTAQINLDYTKVTSPVAGRIGISQGTEALTCSPARPPCLATVQQLDPVYVDVTRPAVSCSA